MKQTEFQFTKPNVFEYMGKKFEITILLEMKEINPEKCPNCGGSGKRSLNFGGWSEEDENPMCQTCWGERYIYARQVPEFPRELFNAIRSAYLSYMSV